MNGGQLAWGVMRVPLMAVFLIRFVAGLLCFTYLLTSISTGVFNVTFLNCSISLGLMDRSRLRPKYSFAIRM